MILVDLKGEQLNAGTAKKLDVYRTFRPGDRLVVTEILYTCDLPINDAFKQRIWYKESQGTSFLRSF